MNGAGGHVGSAGERAVLLLHLQGTLTRLNVAVHIQDVWEGGGKGWKVARVFAGTVGFRVLGWGGVGASLKGALAGLNVTVHAQAGCGRGQEEHKGDGGGAHRELNSRRKCCPFPDP